MWHRVASKVVSRLELSPGLQACLTSRQRACLQLVEHTRVGDGVGKPLPLVQVVVGLVQGG